MLPTLCSDLQIRVAQGPGGETKGSGRWVGFGGVFCRGVCSILFLSCLMGFGGLDTDTYIYFDIYVWMYICIIIVYRCTGEWTALKHGVSTCASRKRPKQYRLPPLLCTEYASRSFKVHDQSTGGLVHRPTPYCKYIHLRSTEYVQCLSP